MEASNITKDVIGVYDKALDDDTVFAKVVELLANAAGVKLIEELTDVDGTPVLVYLTSAGEVVLRYDVFVGAIFYAKDNPAALKVAVEAVGAVLV